MILQSLLEVKTVSVSPPSSCGETGDTGAFNGWLIVDLQVENTIWLSGPWPEVLSFKGDAYRLSGQRR